MTPTPSMVPERIDQEILIIDLQAGTLIAWEPNTQSLTAHFTPPLSLCMRSQDLDRKAVVVSSSTGGLVSHNPHIGGELGSFIVNRMDLSCSAGSD